jgi:sporulation protein YlmC with PRC-barrel domain
LPRFAPIAAVVLSAVAATTALPVLAQPSTQEPATTPPTSTVPGSPPAPSTSPPSATGVVTTTNNPNLAVATLKLENGVRASKIIGQAVQNDQNQRVGKVDDLIVTSGDRITIAIVSVGGFLGMGDKLVAVPWQQLKAEGDHLVLPGASKDTMSAAPSVQY